MTKYPKYKNTGTEWILEIPENWYCSKVKYLSDLVAEKSESIKKV